MSLQEILEHRRATRIYDNTKEIDAQIVKECIEKACLTPTSSNMQLWEAYHITDKKTLEKLSVACLSQLSAKTAKQLVVFVTRQDKYKEHSKAVLNFEVDKIEKHSPANKKESRKKAILIYYSKLMPFLYSRGLGVWGLVRKLLAQTIGVFRPILRQVSEQDMRVTVQKSCGMVAQTFMLAMSEQNYDTCPLEGFDSLRVKKILHLPNSCEINMIVSCGIRAEKGVFGERFRLPFNEFYHRI